ncbi:glutamine amidotransferase subunit [Spiromyces aspiralis]|uniref:Glutamine amidotransferase subunit n=1 Tax=Spiromyces aspiralis TaxID=68401 RepID=A0ACC1HPQ2_9FUNG|nr:glutamine amidotransferase subunit [Spiromyces aspiralis]
MCRMLVFKGESPILLADLLTRPAHSIITQSVSCKLRVDLRRPMNGTLISNCINLDNPMRKRFTHNELREAMLKTIAQINKWLEEANVSEISLLNFAVTDGENVICTRYITSTTHEAATLFFSSGSKFTSEENGQYRMLKANKRESVVVVASEPLTYERMDWMVVPTNTMIVITSKFNVLQYPIIDKHYTPEKRQSFLH